MEPERKFPPEVLAQAAEDATLKEILKKSHIYISAQLWRESNAGKVIDILKDNPFCI